MMVSYDMQQL